MKEQNAEDVLSDICSFCTKKLFCKDLVMVKGINKIIQNVAPGLSIDCKNHNSSLTSDPNSNTGFSPASLKDVTIQ